MGNYTDWKYEGSAPTFRTLWPLGALDPKKWWDFWHFVLVIVAILYTCVNCDSVSYCKSCVSDCVLQLVTDWQIFSRLYMRRIKVRSKTAVTEILGGRYFFWVPLYTCCLKCYFCCYFEHQLQSYHCFLSTASIISAMLLPISFDTDNGGSLSTCVVSWSWDKSPIWHLQTCVLFSLYGDQKIKCCGLFR